MLTSLNRREHDLSSTQEQVRILEGVDPLRFASKVNSGGQELRSEDIKVLQLNLGKMCNQTCVHCHVDAGPDRREIMSKDVLEQCLDVIKIHPFETVDLTGGAPELNPEFRWFVESVSKLGVSIIVRCNLTIILSNSRFADLPQFFARHKVRVVSSLPHFAALRTDRQRGDGVFVKSIKALQMLNDVD
jgi:radical SAM/Cys-rich protein